MVAQVRRPRRTQQTLAAAMRGSRGAARSDQLRRSAEVQDLTTSPREGADAGADVDAGAGVVAVHDSCGGQGAAIEVD